MSGTVSLDEFPRGRIRMPRPRSSASRWRFEPIEWQRRISTNALDANSVGIVTAYGLAGPERFRTGRVRLPGHRRPTSANRRFPVQSGHPPDQGHAPDGS